MTRFTPLNRQTPAQSHVVLVEIHVSRKNDGYMCIKKGKTSETEALQEEEMSCDCSQCIAIQSKSKQVEAVHVLAMVTRSKVKKKRPI